MCLSIVNKWRGQHKGASLSSAPSLTSPHLRPGEVPVSSAHWECSQCVPLGTLPVCSRHVERPTGWRPVQTEERLRKISSDSVCVHSRPSLAVTGPFTRPLPNQITPEPIRLDGDQVRSHRVNSKTLFTRGGLLVVTAGEATPITVLPLFKNRNGGRGRSSRPGTHRRPGPPPPWSKRCM